MITNGVYPGNIGIIHHNQLWDASNLKGYFGDNNGIMEHKLI